ncbi:MAG: single-stranded DNA-binding protein [Luteolibacter sp.]
MANLNKVMLLGNLTRDPELRHTPKGSAVADLGVAVNRKVSDGNGGWKDETTFVDVTVWGSSAENAQKYLSKGRGVFIEGRLQMDTWDDKATGQKRSKLKVVADNLQFLPDGKGGASSRYSQGNDDSQGSSSSRQGGSAAPADDYAEEDDIPF